MLDTRRCHGGSGGIPIGPFAVLAVILCLACRDADSTASRSGSPADALPPYISLLVENGLRPDWSVDGRRMLYLDALVGDVFELDLESKSVRSLTSHFEHAGFSRARYLANDDVLLCGPPHGGTAKADGGRWHTELWVLASTLEAPAIPLGESCFEGPAVSRRNLRIAWTVSDYPDEIVFGRSEIWTGEIDYAQGKPKLERRRKVLDRSDFAYLAFLETQDFVPPDETELLFTAYAYKGGEVMGLDLETGEINDYSRNWGYDEAEGVFPDGRFAAVEREPDTYFAVPNGRIDLWRTALDGSGRTDRLTRFTDFAGYGANNPVVHPSGRWLAFQLREAGGEHGNGHGIFLLDLAEWEASRDGS